MFYSCGEKKTYTENLFPNSNTIDLNIDSLSVEESIALSSIIRDYKIVPLETNEKCLIGMINQIEVYENKIFILDYNVARSLFVFDVDGNFLYKIGDVGKGPGEYLAPNCFAIDKKGNILIIDYSQKKILRYSENGVYINDIDIPTSGLPRGLIIDNNYMYIDNWIVGEIDDGLLYGLDFKGNIKTKWLESSKYGKGYNGNFSLTDRFFFQNGSKIRYLKQFIDTIFTINNSVVSPYIVIKTRYGFNNDEIEEMNSAFNNRTGLKDLVMKYKNKYWGVIKFQETDDIIFLSLKYLKKNISLFYKKEINNINAFYNIEDDITFTSYLSFNHSTDSCLISAICCNDFGNNYSLLLRNIENGKVKLNENYNINTSDNSNPIMIFYFTKKQNN
jgi:hypothetical protein